MTKIKNLLICTTLLFLSITILSAQSSKGSVSEPITEYWNMGIGYDAKNNDYTAYALDLKAMDTRSDSEGNGSTLRYTVIENKHNLNETSFLGIDLGLDINVPFVQVKASSSMDIYNSIKTSQSCVTMIISFEHVKETLDVTNAQLSNSAQTYLNTNGVSAFVIKYGDRYLDKIQIGGRLNFVYRLSVSERSKLDKFKLKIACEVLVNSIFKGQTTIDNDKISEEEMSQIVKEVDVFYNGLPWRADVKNYEEYCELRDKFIEWLNNNTVVVTKRYKKYNELQFADTPFYQTLNDWYYLREIVNSGLVIARENSNWEMEIKCSDSLAIINRAISEMNPEAENKKAIFSEFKEIFDYVRGQEQFQISKAVPAGTVVSYLGAITDIPIGWVLCDGALVSKDSYKDLYNIIGDTFNTEITPADHFNLPDLRGQFLRGLDTSGLVDPDGSSRRIGSKQEDEFKEHNHKVHGTNHENTPVLIDYSPYEYGRYINNHTSTAKAGGIETRPKNVAVHFIIKY